MTAADFRRIALSLAGVEEISHAGLPAFRVGGRRFASLASQAGGYGNLTLTLPTRRTPLVSVFSPDNNFRFGNFGIGDVLRYNVTSRAFIDMIPLCLRTASDWVDRLLAFYGVV
jgi:hypothetical protein